MSGVGNKPPAPVSSPSHKLVWDMFFKYEWSIKLCSKIKASASIFPLLLLLQNLFAEARSTQNLLRDDISFLQQQPATAILYIVSCLTLIL